MREWAERGVEGTFRVVLRICIVAKVRAWWIWLIFCAFTLFLLNFEGEGTGKEARKERMGRGISKYYKNISMGYS